MRFHDALSQEKLEQPLLRLLSNFSREFSYQKFSHQKSTKESGVT